MKTHLSLDASTPQPSMWSASQPTVAWRAATVHGKVARTVAMPKGRCLRRHCWSHLSSRASACWRGRGPTHGKTPSTLHQVRKGVMCLRCGVTQAACSDTQVKPLTIMHEPDKANASASRFSNNTSLPLAPVLCPLQTTALALVLTPALQTKAASAALRRVWA